MNYLYVYIYICVFWDMLYKAIRLGYLGLFLKSGLAATIAKKKLMSGL